MLPTPNKRSVLFITLDSCRYDTFVAAKIPNLRAIGSLHKAMSPGNFTYSSHSAMFVGFTPGVAKTDQCFVNPKVGKIFKMAGAGHPGKGPDFLQLDGHNIIEGLKRQGYKTIGSGAVGWFDPGTETGQNLTRDFDRFYFPGNTFSLGKQLTWIYEELEKITEPAFVFLNVGETHVPYYYEGAPWDVNFNPCVPFANTNDERECRLRQQECLEYIDRAIAPLLGMFANCSIIICADHGDCWGEDGLWEHGIHHEKVLEVPLLFRLI